MKTPAMNYKFLLLILVLAAFAQGIGYGQEPVSPVNESGTDATLSRLTASPVDIVGFDSDVTEYHVGVANTVTQVSITATATDAGATIEIGKSETDKNTAASGSVQVILLDEGRNTVYVWVTSQSGTIKKIYTITVGRSVDSAYGWKAIDDFNTLRAAGNRSIDGIWSDGTTMWVADESGDEKLYAYDMISKEHVPEKDINTLDAADNDAPDGIWSDGTTMYVADDPSFFEKIYAYDMATGARDRDKDINALEISGNDNPEGIWSDGTTMWVADISDEKLYAYDMTSKERVPDKDFNTLDAAGNDDPTGIWSDGTTMWVADDWDEKLYAYDMMSKERVPDKDFNTLKSAGNGGPEGIWSDGTTMWVADDWDEKIYAYNMPSNGGTTAGVTDFNGDGQTDLADFLLFVEQFGLSRGDAGYDARYDLDGDGSIGFGDFLIFANAFGQEGT